MIRYNPFKILTLAILFILLFAGCSYLKNVQLLTGGKLERKDFVEEIPFEMRKDLIVVQATINNEQVAREFIFDTGAFNSKIEKQLADILGLANVTSKENSTAQGVTRRVEVTRVDTVRLGDTPFYDIGAGKLVYDEQSASPCIAAHGIIGANLMKLTHWQISFENQVIRFSDEPFQWDETKESYKMEFTRPALSGVPSVDIELEGKTVQNVLFDVGFNGALVLPMSVAHHFTKEEEKMIFDRSTSGIYGTNTDTLIIRELRLNLGGYETIIPVEFSAIGKALIGNELLKHFNVNIDYKKKEIILFPFRDIFVENAYEFIPGVLNDSLWVVDRTTASLPVALGDTLVSVNGKKPYDLFDSYCDYVMNIGELLNAKVIELENVDGKIVRVK